MLSQMDLMFSGVPGSCSNFAIPFSTAPYNTDCQLEVEISDDI